MIRLQRLKYELGPSAYKPPGISFWKDENNDFQIHADIKADENTPYSNMVFRLVLNVPNKYPFEPPDVRFITPIYHPNIDTSGRICLDILKVPPSGSWSPSLHFGPLLTMIKQLLAEPNPEDPLMPEIAAEYKFNRSVFNRKVKEYSKNNQDVSMFLKRRVQQSDDHNLEKKPKLL